MTQLSLAVDTADAKNLNPILVNYVLNRVTLDEVVQQGSTPVESVLQTMRKTLSDMTQTIQSYANETANAGKSFGQAFKDLFSGNVGASGHDFQQSWNDFASSVGDLGQFLLDTGEFVWESVFEMTAAALIQCAEEIWQAANRCTHALSDLIAKSVQLVSGIVKDDQTIINDVKKGDYTDALNELLNDTINPELKMAGLQQVSASQLEEIIQQQVPGLWTWFQSLPWWAWVAVIGVIIAVLIATFVARMFAIQAALAAQDISATKGQIWSLLWQGYSNQAIESILLTTNVQKSEGMSRTITNPDGSLHTFIGHTRREHIAISDASMIDITTKFNAAGGKGMQTSFPDLATAQNGVNHVIAHSSTLQDFILHGTAGSSAHDIKCNKSRNFGYGYIRIIDKRGKIRTSPKRIGPLHCVYVLIAKNIFGIPYIEDAYPTES